MSFVSLREMNPHYWVPLNFYFMSLSYRNYSTDEILKQCRNIDYAACLDLYSSVNNNIEIVSELKIDLLQLKQQADIFAKQMLVHKSKADFKRFLGSRDDKWKKLLHEAYVYDRCRSIYYGLNSVFMSKFPASIHSFVGNVLLANLLKDNTRKFDTKDVLQYNLYFRVDLDRKAMKLLDPVFEIYPNLKTGMSIHENSYSYINAEYESILTGLYNAKNFIERNNTTSNSNNNGSSTNSNASASSPRATIFDMCTLDSDTVLQFFSDAQYPFMNSFLNDSGDKFSFILPSNESKPESIKHNESVFLARSLGLVSKGVFRQENNIYCSVPRKFSSDNLIYNEVYSVTGLKTEMLPDSEDFINAYLSLPKPKSDDLGGGGNTP